MNLASLNAPIRSGREEEKRERRLGMEGGKGGGDRGVEVGEEIVIGLTFAPAEKKKGG